MRRGPPSVLFRVVTREARRRPWAIQPREMPAFEPRQSKVMRCSDEPLRGGSGALDFFENGQSRGTLRQSIFSPDEHAAGRELQGYLQAGLPYR